MSKRSNNTSSKSASSDPPPSPPAQESSDSPLDFMFRSIYIYMCQYGFQESAEHFLQAIHERFPHGKGLSVADKEEGILRCSMYRCFTMTSPQNLQFFESGTIVLDDIDVISKYVGKPLSSDNTLSSLDVLVRVHSVLSALHAHANDAQIIKEIINQYFPTELLDTPKKKETSAAADRRKLLVKEYELLQQYYKNRNSKDKKIKIANDKYLETHQFTVLLDVMRQFLTECLSSLNIQGEVFLERIAQQFQAEEGKVKLVKTNTSKQDKEKDKVQQEKEEEEEEEEEEDEDEEMESEPEPTPVPVKNKGGRPRKTPLPAPAAPAAPVTAPSPVRTTRAARTTSLASSPQKPVNDVSSRLISASKTLKSRGVDPMQSVLAASDEFSKSKKRAAPIAIDEEDDDEVAVDDIIKKPKSGIRKNRYDQPSATAEKLQFDDGEIEVGEVKSSVTLPAFKTKPSTALNTNSNNTTTPVKKSLPKATSSSKKSPVVLQHKVDRSIRRIPWTEDEVAALTQGMLEFGQEHTKWQKIATKYADRFLDRTPIDLKDKWRNEVKKSQKVGPNKRQRTTKPRDDVDPIEEIDDDEEE